MERYSRILLRSIFLIGLFMSSSTDKNSLYEITPEGWGSAHKAAWLEEQSVKRSYQEEVVSKIEALKDTWEVEQYGALSYDQDRYPLFLLKTKKVQSRIKVQIISYKSKKVNQ